MLMNKNPEGMGHRCSAAFGERSASSAAVQTDKLGGFDR